MIFNAIFMVIMVCIDQATKALAKAYLAHKPLGLMVVPKAFYLTYAENTGASFGIFKGKSRLLGIVSAVSSVALIVFLSYQSKSAPDKRLYLFSITMIISGALGNMVDRLFRGYVIDFFDFRLIHFAIFNVADSLISVGAVIFCYYMLFDKELFKG